ncbi:MAG: helix-hairpin-helix domain-containing protein [Nitrospira sp.]|nr:helix-hairpin-helix domain-containing protein [Nitrospira sp.]
MIRSLGLKLALLAITMGVVFWIRWQPAELQRNDSESTSARSGTVNASIVDPQPRGALAIQTAVGPNAATPEASNHIAAAGHAGPRLVDLNSATRDELESLPGIGAVLAQRVIAYRQSVGRFLAVEDLREVKGIGSKTFDRIKPWVTVAKGEQKSKVEKRPS